MKFHDIVKSMSGVCCTAVGCCGGNVSGMDDVKGDNSEKNNELVQLVSLRQSDPYFYASICISFPCFLGCCGNHLEKWPDALEHISKSVTLLRSAKFNDDLEYARPAVSRISSMYTFKNMVKFCHSDFCDASSREILSSLFHLVPLVMRRLPILSEWEKIIKGATSYFPDEVIADYTVFLENIIPVKPLISMEDASLFQRVYDIFSAHIISNF
jgi:hypothetical protein